MDKTIYQQRTVKVSTVGGNRIGSKEAAKRIGIPLTTLYAHLRKGNILRAEPEHTALDRVPADFFVQDVDAFIAKRKTKTTSED
jgi:hypothetical protein